MKCEVFVLGGQRIDQEEQEGMEKRLEEMRKGRREDEKGSHCLFKSSGYDKLELKHQNFKLIECIIKMSWCETECKNESLVNRMY